MNQMRSAIAPRAGYADRWAADTEQRGDRHANLYFSSIEHFDGIDLASACITIAAVTSPN